jgi:hypothetical protein
MERLRQMRARRDPAAVALRLQELENAASGDTNLMLISWRRRKPTRP